MTVDQLPRPYQLIQNIVASINLVADGTVSPIGAGAVLDAAREFATELAIELWKAGQVERRAIDPYQYDPPLWCKGMVVEEVTRAVGVPTVAASDPTRDLGRGKSYR